MKRLIRIIVRWPLGCLILFNAGCENGPTYKSYIPTKQDSLARQAFIERGNRQLGEIKKQVHNGDLITRTGNDFTSESLRSLNQRDQTFSHCGIASIEHDSIFVYHALGGEFNPDQKIRRDPIESFGEASGNKCMAIFRFLIADSIKENFAKTARALYEQEIMFDMNFDLQTDDRMYCAEYVYKTFEKASDGKLSFNRSHIRQFEFVGVDDIFLHQLCRKQVQVIYK